MVEVLAAHGRGDSRNIWIVTDAGVEEITPAENTEEAAREVARAMGVRYYLRRSAQGDEFGWAAYRADGWRSDSIGSKWFATQDAAIMYASIKGG